MTHAYVGVISHIQIGHVTRMNVRHDAYLKRDVGIIPMVLIGSAFLNESCHAYESVVTQV